ncbi:MAG: hypothetical protein ACRYGR_06210 [Janthinobacterium lividum]
MIHFAATEEYLRLENLEKAFLHLRVQLAQQEGFVGIDESKKLLNDLINA